MLHSVQLRETPASLQPHQLVAGFPGVELLSGSESVHLLDALDQPADVQIPTLTIEEQPARFYRFRYESEIEKDSGRVGGLLLGRSSTDGNKSFMRVRVSDINPAVHSQLQLTVCTVSAEENAPHPYYLHGDHCSNGYFQLNKSVTSKDFWDVSFDRLAVIRVTKQKNKNSEMDMEARRNNLPAFLHCKDYATDKLNEIRLVFCLEFTDTNGQNWQLNNPEFSDKISSAKEKKNIEITSLNPVEVPIKGRCMIAIHSSNPTTGIPMRDVKVHFIVTNVDTKQKAVYVRDVDVMKKHILLVTAPDMSQASVSDRQKCSVTVCSNGFESEEINIILVKTSMQEQIQGSRALKRPLQK